jgi:hypothetical protein
MDAETYVPYWTELKESIPQSSTLLMKNNFYTIIQFISANKRWYFYFTIYYENSASSSYLSHACYNLCL